MPLPSFMKSQGRGILPRVTTLVSFPPRGEKLCRFQQTFADNGAARFALNELCSRSAKKLVSDALSAPLSVCTNHRLAENDARIYLSQSTL